MDQKIVHEFSRLRVLSNRKSDPPSPSRTRKIVSKKMDALVHDLNTALELDEANNSSANAASGSGATGNNRRRVWRRRCKSTRYVIDTYYFLFDIFLISVFIIFTTFNSLMKSFSTFCISNQYYIPSICMYIITVI